MRGRRKGEEYPGPGVVQTKGEDDEASNIVACSWVGSWHRYYISSGRIDQVCSFEILFREDPFAFSQDKEVVPV
jgi:hypothetical protein